jgi:hypothetical protein
MKKTTQVVSAVLLLALFSIFLQAVTPKKWDLYQFQEFLRGKFSGISVSTEGLLSLSPREEKIQAPAEEFFLSFLIGREGTIYLGTGHSGNIYTIDSSGKIEAFAQVPEMDVYCLAQDSRGDIYAGTSPNGKIYRITQKDKTPVVFFNPQERYIWDLMFVDQGHLLAAVGEAGGIYEISPQGEGISILKADENHILCLARAENGDILAGSGGKGHLYRMEKGKSPRVLFESPFEEIKSIAIGTGGSLYIATGGRSQDIIKDGLDKNVIRAATDMEITVTATPVEGQSKSAASKAGQPGALYKLSAEGVVKRLWGANDEMIYSVVWDESRKRVLFGTGNKGRLYSADADDRISLILQKDSEQLYHIQPADSKMYLLANNPAELSILHNEQRTEGDYLSRSLDAGLLASWGQLSWEGEMPKDTTILLQTRSGNTEEPGKAWSDWSPPYKNGSGEQILSPRGRYVQFKINLRSRSNRISPQVSLVSLNYVQANFEPSFSSLELLPPNVVYVKPPSPEEVIWGLEDNRGDDPDEDSQSRSYLVPKITKMKGYQTLVWQATDPNFDELVYSIYIRDLKEAQWRLLKKDWLENIFAFDTYSLPDGTYLLRVEASDGMSNPPGGEETAEKITRRLVIDNSLPEVRNLQVKRSSRVLSVAFTAVDSYSAITEVKVLVRPDVWAVVFPEDGICDSKTESFKFTLPLPAGADNVVTVKVKDAKGNVGVARSSF